MSSPQPGSTAPERWAPPHGQAPAAPVPVPVRPGRDTTPLVVAAVIGFLVLGFALLLVAGYFLLALGAGLTFVGGIMALVPLGIVLLGVRWVDRWEPEPFPVLLIGFLWGATVAVLVALVVDASVQTAAALGGTTPDELLQTIVQAPIVEELAKGLGVLLICLVGRQFFDGPIDGVTYGAIVGGGFAFTENIQYFGLEVAGADPDSIGWVFFVRGLLSPFAHAMFTAVTGLAIGAAVRRGGRPGAALGALVGLVPALLLHMLWNTAATFAGENFFVYYLLVQVPLFIAMIVVVSMLQRREIRVTQERLTEYALAGWFNPAEVQTLATRPGRRAAMGWAKPIGLGPTMRDYIRDATRLAFTRQRMLGGRDLAGSQADERAILGRITETRRKLLAPQIAAALPGSQPAPPTGAPRSTTF